MYVNRYVTQELKEIIDEEFRGEDSFLYNDYTILIWKKSLLHSFDTKYVIEINKEDKPFPIIDIKCFVFDFKNVTRDILEQMNAFNSTYKVFQFYVDDERTLTLEANVLVTPDKDLSLTAYEVITKMVQAHKITDHIYPEVRDNVIIRRK